MRLGHEAPSSRFWISDGKFIDHDAFLGGEAGIPIRTSSFSSRYQTIRSKATVIGPRCGGDSSVFHEDAPDLPDHRGMVQANVEAMDNQFGGGALQM